jgi:hypothetical protein
MARAEIALIYFSLYINFEELGNTIPIIDDLNSKPNLKIFKELIK